MGVGRLVIAIVSTIVEEAAIAVAGFWLLPRAGFAVHPAVVLLIMAGWGGWAVFTYRAGSRALKKKETIGLVSMVGARGEVVSELAPRGMVRVHGEIWSAESVDGSELSPGTPVVVVAQERLRLYVRADAAQR